MIHWTDIAGIVFVCVTMNHLGLVSAIESAIDRKLWIVDCPKCASFWATLVYGCYKVAAYGEGVVTVLAVSFLASYMAIWLELIEGLIDTLYMKIYAKIYPDSADDTVAPASDAGNTAGSVPEL